MRSSTVRGAPDHRFTRASRGVQGRSCVPVLAYHRIASSPDHVQHGVPSAGLSEFERQVHYLSQSSYGTLPLTRLVNTIARHPSPSVVITFDDGWSSTLTLALPVLRSCGMTATVFVTTDPTASVFDPCRAADPPLGPEGWRELAEAGWEIGSHTRTHPPLVSCSDAVLRDELVSSKRNIEDAIGRSVSFLAAPYGLSDARVRGAAAEAGYLGMCPGDTGLSRWCAPPYQIRRLGVGPHTDLRAFRRLLTPWGASVVRMSGIIKLAIRRGIGHRNSMALRRALLRFRAAMGERS